jgi:HAD superfamily hydrolase (TIGR01490 family)
MIVHLFDIDHTLVSKTTAKYFLLMAVKQKIIRFSQVSHLFIDWIKYKLAIPDNDFIEKIVKNMIGIDKKTLEQMAEICFQKNIKPNIYTDAYDFIQSTIQKGEILIFATSTFDFIIKPIEDFFGIKDSIATKMEYIDNKTTGKLNGYSFFGPKKKTASLAWMEKNGINPKDVSFYSDSYTDIPLLECCGNPVVVNPDMILKKRAIKSGWKIIYYKKTLGKTKPTN